MLKQPVTNRAEPVGRENGKRVTVLVCTRNRPDDVARLLESLRRQSFPDFDILIVDQSTDDWTQQLVQGFESASLRYERHDQTGKSRALDGELPGRMSYFDTSPSRYELIARLTPSWLADGLAELEADPAIGLLFGNFVPATHDRRREFIPAIHFNTPRTFHGKPWRSYGLVGMGGEMFRSRCLFDSVGGFDEDLGPGGPLRTGEECELTYRALVGGFAVAQRPHIRVTHWGARPLANGVAKKLVNDGFFAVGAGYGKHIRRGEIRAAIIAAHESLWALGLTGKAIAGGKGPFHLRRNALFWQGVVQGFRYRLATPAFR
ncbi:MAG: glycosyltransferase [Dehalococcoidia bacterium]|nr:glycosyltransferase [Dehalococcoidia bacterium]